MAKVNFKIEGMRELEKTIKKLGKVPQRSVTKSAKKGMSIALNSAKSKSPYLTGELEEGIKLYGEKSKVKGKKVYRVIFDPDKNDIFQKKNKEGKVTAYYPVSQEYGFRIVDPETGEQIGFHEGLFFVSKGFNENGYKITKTIVEVMGKEIDKAMR